MLNDELEILANFSTKDHLALSIYIDLSTPQRKRDPLSSFRREFSRLLSEKETLREDIELVDLHLRSNGSRQSNGLAIFSCAGEYFWRVYRLSTPVSDQLYISSTFNIEPLREVLEHEGVLLREVVEAGK